MFGRILALDGIIQTTTGDEFVYHEMIAHVPILAHGRAAEVLVIGVRRRGRGAARADAPWRSAG